jgi:hypothetical protein
MVKNLPKLDSELADIMVECHKSTKMFAKVFFPERFSSEFSPLHDQIFELIDSGAPRIAIAAPRGIGKTSIVGLAKAGKDILFRDKKFLAFVSMSATSAELQTENLKFELASNDIVAKAFGPVKPIGGGTLDESFSKKSWVGFDTLIYPRGSGQQIRGLLYHNSRPDIIIIDDLEDPETINNEEVRMKRRVWFHADLEKCVSRIEKNWQIIYIDTLKHEDSLLEELLESKDWESVRLELCDDEFNSNAPQFISTEEIKKEAEYHRTNGMMDVFYREYRNIPISKEDAVFRPEFFRYYEETDLVNPKPPKKAPNLVNVVIVDPAKTLKLSSADSAVVGWGVDLESRDLYIRDVISGKFTPEELYDHMFGMVVSLGAFILAVEVTSLEQFIVQPIKNEMRKRNLFPQLVELKAVSHKEERVATLAPHYRLGHVLHNKNVCQKLESQLLGFPKSKTWDVMDAAAYITKVMEMHEMYFYPPEKEKDVDEFDEVMDEREMDQDLLLMGIQYDIGRKKKLARAHY